MTREEAIRHIRDILAENNSIKPSMVVFELEKEALYMAIKALEQQPTRPTGKWKEYLDEGGFLYCECFNCGHITNEPDNYCPNCGARMEGRT